MSAKATYALAFILLLAWPLPRLSSSLSPYLSLVLYSSSLYEGLFEQPAATRSRSFLFAQSPITPLPALLCESTLVYFHELLVFIIVQDNPLPQVDNTLGPFSFLSSVCPRL